jgi:hypothetical protein
MLARVGAWVTVIGGVIGVLLALLGLPHTIASAIGHSESKVTAETRKLELEQKRLATLGPELDVSYVFLSSDVDVGRPTGTSKSRAILGYPEVRNRGFVGASSDTAPKACRLGRYPSESTGYLVIENRGRRDATRSTSRPAATTSRESAPAQPRGRRWRSACR